MIDWQAPLRTAVALALLASPATMAARQPDAATLPPEGSASKLSSAQASAAQASAAETDLVGAVTDSLGGAVPEARVELLAISGTEVLQSTTTDSRGLYEFALAAPGRYRVRVRAASFQPVLSDAAYAPAAQSVHVDLVLAPAAVSQDIVVTATGVPTPELQTGASISVIDFPLLSTRRAVDEELPLQPGAQITSSGQTGAQTSLFLRGSPSNSVKVLIDGVAANDIGGYFNFANLAAAGIDSAELHRGPDSALYGADALAGVLVLKSRRGFTPLPELSYSIGGGNYGTLNQEGNLGGAWRRWDYFADFTRFDTQNSTPNSHFHNASGLANIGFQLLPSTSLRATVRRSVSVFNAANAFDLYGIADDGQTRESDTSFGVTLNHSASPRWHNMLRYTGLRLRSTNSNFGPTGIPYDPYNTGFPVYLGKVMTIRGANGYEVTGQAILQYGSGTSESFVVSNRDALYAQTDFRYNKHLAALFGFRYETEGGYQNYGFANYARSRGNYSYTVQLNGSFRERLYYVAGTALEYNDVFGFAPAPRVSLGWHLVRPRSEGTFSGTRLVFNFAKGIREPSIYTETNSVYEILRGLPAQSGYPSGAEIIAQYNIAPFRAEQARSFDGGIQQLLFHGRARVSLTYFHNQFDDQSEWVPYFALQDFGVAPDAVAALQAANPYGGATINSLSYRARGTELEAEYHITHNLSARGGWTWTDAVVEHSYYGELINAVYNPAFPGVAIGAFAPLNGARPFRIAPNTGYFAVDYHTSRLMLRLTGSLVSRRDDSDFLAYADADFGNSLVLPNRNLDPAYQRLDLFGSFQFSKRVRAYAAMQNLLNQSYYEAFGYPALPFTIRSGMQFTIGGDSWKF
jgi:vitamin B12 transporter